MFYINTSQGKISFFLDSQYFSDKDVHNIEFNQIQFSNGENGLNLLKYLYTMDSYFSILKYENTYFLQIHLSDGYYGLPEYEIHKESNVEI